MFRRFSGVALATLMAAASGLAPAGPAFAQKKDEPKREEKAAPKKEEPAKESKSATAEQVAETVIFVFGSRERLAQIRRSGVERGRLTRTAGDGRTEEIAYERVFKRGESLAKDKVRLDQKRPSLEYSLIFNDGRVWGLIKGTPFTPRQEEVADFLAESQHGLDALLRYKEEGATLSLAGKDKQKGIEMWMLDLMDKEQHRTRYFVSTKTGRVLALEYEDTPTGGGTPVKYRRTFHDYRVVQGTNVPYRSVLYENDKQVEESQINSVVYGIKMDDAVFQNPEAAVAQP